MGWKEHAQIQNYKNASGDYQELNFPPPFPTCQNGDVKLGYGSPQFIGLGVSVMFGLVVIELFGSTFMK